MVQNGDHKCTKKFETENIEEKTISEEQIVHSKVSILIRIHPSFSFSPLSSLTLIVYVFLIIIVSSPLFFIN